MPHLSDSRQIHQSEVDDAWGKYLQMNRLLADSLQRDENRVDKQSNRTVQQCVAERA